MRLRSIVYGCLLISWLAAKDGCPYLSFSLCSPSPSATVRCSCSEGSHLYACLLVLILLRLWAIWGRNRRLIVWTFFGYIVIQIAAMACLFYLVAIDLRKCFDISLSSLLMAYCGSSHSLGSGRSRMYLNQKSSSRESLGSWGMYQGMLTTGEVTIFVFRLPSSA